MIRIDGFYLYTVGYSIHPLSEMSANAPFEDWLLPLYVAQEAVDKLLNSSVYHPQFSRAAGLKLLGVLNNLIAAPNRTEPVTHYEKYQVATALAEFEHVLAADLGMMNIWLVSQKRGYDTNALIQEGWSLFPDDLRRKVPEAIPDVVAATQCIAFTLFTAAAFHLHRANESVLHRYYDLVTNGAPRPGSRNMGDYLAELNKQNVGNPKILSALKDLKDLHRNPLIHPEESLGTIDEAIALLGGVQAAINLMLKAIPEAQQEALQLEAPAP
jgi:hypothetical protein